MNNITNKRRCGLMQEYKDIQPQSITRIYVQSCGLMQEYKDIQLGKDN